MRTTTQCHPRNPCRYRWRRGGAVRGRSVPHVPALRRLACWRFEVLDISETGIGGFKEATASITGRDVFARLKFESGVHRVQRVPETEASGRIHTSAATVAVLPEAEEVDVKIDDKALRIDVFAPAGLVGSRSTRPTARCGSRICRPVLS